MEDDRILKFQVSCVPDRLGHSGCRPGTQRTDAQLGAKITHRVQNPVYPVDRPHYSLPHLPDIYENVRSVPGRPGDPPGRPRTL